MVSLFRKPFTVFEFVGGCARRLLSDPPRFHMKPSQSLAKLGSSGRSCSQEPPTSRRSARGYSFHVDGAADADAGELDDQSIASMKWGMIRRLHGERALVYSLQDRKLARIQAALRNKRRLSSNEETGAAAPPRLPWYTINSRSTFKKRFDFIVSIAILYSIFMLPLRLGFDFEAEGYWFIMVSAC